MVGKVLCNTITHWNLSIHVIPATFEEYSKEKKCKHGQKIWDTYDNNSNELEANFEKNYSKLGLKLNFDWGYFHSPRKYCIENWNKRVRFYPSFAPLKGPYFQK